jgi:hypothetical protein
MSDMKVIHKNKHAEPFSSGKRRKLDNFKMAVGMGSNWADLDSGVMYMIQEYAEALHDPKIPKDKKPTKIRMVKISTGEDLGWADETVVEMRMQDPEPDPRY